MKFTGTIQGSAFWFKQKNTPLPQEERNTNTQAVENDSDGHHVQEFLKFILLRQTKTLLKTWQGRHENKEVPKKIRFPFQSRFCC